MFQPKEVDDGLCMALMWRCAAPSSITHCSLEHPRSAFSWALPEVERFRGRLEELDLGGIVDYDACAFGPSREGVLHKKPSRLLWVRAAWLRGLGRRCPGHHAHVQVAHRTCKHQI